MKTEPRAVKRWQLNGCPLCKPLDGVPCEKHGPKPLAWYATTSAGGQQGLIADENDKTGRTIALTYDPKDAARIVRAVNSHAGLVAALTALANVTGEKGMDKTVLSSLVAEARTALRAAGEL